MFCSTQHRVELTSILHCPMQHGVVPPGMQALPRLAHIEQTPPTQLIPMQQSLLPEHDWLRPRHWQVPPEQSIAPQQSDDAVHRAAAIAHAQRPPVHARPLQQSLAPVQAAPDLLQQLPITEPVFDVHDRPVQHRCVAVLEHDIPAGVHIVPIITQRPP